MSLEEGGPLERPQLAANAHRLKIVEHGLADIGIGRVAVVFARVKAIRTDGLGQ